jgi:protein-S-isoprenylcysteine O-methyltransferase Ste14
MKAETIPTSQATAPAPPGLLNRFADRVWAFNDWYMHRIPIGPAIASPRMAINLHKVSVGPLTLALMALAGDWSLAAWMYLALHGLYGILWVAKDIAYGDPSWTGKATVGSAAGVFVFPLALYYLPPLLMLTSLGETIPGGWGTTATLPVEVAFAAVVCFILGAFFHFVADAHKYFVLAHQRPRRLITGGMFALTRNPNYFGEMLIYASFNLLAQHWLPWVACSLVWSQVFLVNMLRKERSMSRYPEHAAWVRETGFLFPSLLTLVKKLPHVFKLPAK